MARRKNSIFSEKVRIPKELKKSAFDLREIANLRYSTQAFKVMQEAMPYKILGIKKEKKRLKIIWEQEFKI